MIIFLETQFSAGATALVLMLVAAILGFIIGYIYWRRLVTNEKTDTQDSNHELEALRAHYEALQLSHTQLQKDHESAIQRHLDEKALREKREKDLQDTKAQMDEIINYHGRAKELRHWVPIREEDPGIDLNHPLITHATQLQEHRDHTDKEDPLHIRVHIRDHYEFFENKATNEPVSAKGKKPKKKKESKEETLARIQEKMGDIDYDTIGTAIVDAKDDLKRIKGIGPFIEEKLNSIEIFTFDQISKFTPALEDKVNEVIEFFPGRIRRDKWAHQAKLFVKEKEEKKESESPKP